jgi:hypothetical protein
MAASFAAGPDAIAAPQDKSGLVDHNGHQVVNRRGFRQPDPQYRTNLATPVGRFQRHIQK